MQVPCKFHLPKAAKRPGLTQALGGNGGIIVFLILVFAAFGVIIASYVVRVCIFNAAQHDEVAAPYLDDTFPTTFSDFLWLHLYRHRDRIDQRHRYKIVIYFWLTVLGAVLLLAAVLAHWLAA